MRHSLPFLFALSTLAAPIAAQEPAPSSIAVTGTGSVELEPDYAVIVFGVDVRGETPQTAAAEMDLRLTAVADTLADIGFPADRLPSAGFSVRPNRSSRAVAEDRFDASSSVRLEVREMGRLPELIGAVLTAGATTVTNLAFHADDQREGRDVALEQAVAEAHRDAERLAAAAGARLGRLIEITSVGERPIIGYSSNAIRLSGLAVGAPITPRMITVSATATVRWD